MKRILASYRRKILAVYPTAQFTDEYMLGCTVNQWADQIEKSFGDGMIWENYGTEWAMVSRTPRKNVDMADASQFYNYFRAGQFVATPKNELPSYLRNLRNVKTPAPETPVLGEIKAKFTKAKFTKAEAPQGDTGFKQEFED